MNDDKILSDENLTAPPEEEGADRQKENGTAQFMKLLGWAIIIVGVIAAIVIFGQANDTYGGAGSIMRLYGGATFFSGVASGSLFIALGEIINLLDRLTGTYSSHTESS